MTTNQRTDMLEQLAIEAMLDAGMDNPYDLEPGSRLARTCEYFLADGVFVADSGKVVLGIARPDDERIKLVVCTERGVIYEDVTFGITDLGLQMFVAAAGAVR